MAPEVVFLANQWLLVAQSVSKVTLERHRGANGQVCVRPRSVDGDTRIHAGVRVQRDHCRNAKVHRIFGLVCTIFRMEICCVSQSYVRRWCGNSIQEVVLDLHSA